MYRLIRIPALMLALAISCLCAAPAAADATFEVSGIRVDASAKSTAEARTAAVASGRPVAWGILFKRLTRQQDWARQPALDAATLQRMVIGYFPINERRSTTRYVAEMTYTFNPEMVARVLQGAGIPYTSVAAKKILMVPMSPGFARGTAWVTAFLSPRFATAPVPFAVPFGDASDMSHLGGLSFDGANWDHIATVAARFKATEAVFVLAAPVGNKLQISIKRVGQGEMPTKSVIEVPLLQNVQATYPGAADAAVRAIDDMWKTQKAVDYSQKGHLIADVRTGSLAHFAALENTIAAVPNVASVNVAAMDIGAARLAISYIGTTDQLKAALAQAGVTLRGGPGNWQIAGQP